MDSARRERVSILSQNPQVFCAEPGDAPAAALSAVLHRPFSGTPPFPAAVVLGPGGDRLGQRLADHGAAALTLDSAAARGHTRLGSGLVPFFVTEAMGVSDAIAGLTWLAARPDVDATRIAVLGVRGGAVAAVLTAYRQIATRFAPDGPRFCAHMAHVASAPVRLEDYRTTGAPVTLMAGAGDPAVDVGRLGLIAGDLSSGGSSVDNLVFAGAGHGWDGAETDQAVTRINLKRATMRLTPDNVLLDDASGHAVTGRAARLAFLARRVRLCRVTAAPDPDVQARCERTVLAAMGLRARDGAL